VNLPVGSGPVTTTTTAIPTTTTVVPTQTTTTTTTTTTVTTTATTIPTQTTTTTTPVPTDTGNVPVMPHTFFGAVLHNGQPAPVGTTIEARGTGVQSVIGKNPVTVSVVGTYGGAGVPQLQVSGSVADGTPLSFYVNGVKAEVFDVSAAGPWQDTFPFHSFSTTELNLRTLAEPPFADFEGSPKSAGIFASIQFFDRSTGFPTTWNWDFGDGTTSTEQNPIHRYQRNDQYTVSLTVSNALGSDTEVKNAYITIYQTGGGGGGGGTPSQQYISTWTNPTPNVTSVVTPTPTVTGGTDGNIPYSSDGTVRHSVTVGSDDGFANLSIGEGSRLTGAGGAPVFKVTMTRVPAGNVPPVPAGELFAFAGYAFDLKPEGTTFEPAATLGFTIPESEWGSLAGQDLSIRWFNQAGGQWETLPTSVDPATRTVSTQISHMSIFALFTPIQPTPEPTTIVQTPTAMPTPAPGISGDLLSTLLKVIVIVIIIVAAVIVVFFFIRKRKKAEPAPGPSIDEDADWMNLK
ncbi:MAG: PKD domain-containing protein, partial [Methanoregulaceae archaeon]|nr:PKD domain-containing protein [Methanoregulaceae archaeon]